MKKVGTVTKVGTVGGNSEEGGDSDSLTIRHRCIHFFYRSYFTPAS